MSYDSDTLGGAMEGVNNAGFGYAGNGANNDLYSFYGPAGPNSPYGGYSYASDSGYYGGPTGGPEATGQTMRNGLGLTIDAFNNLSAAQKAGLATLPGGVAANAIGWGATQLDKAFGWGDRPANSPTGQEIDPAGFQSGGGYSQNSDVFGGSYNGGDNSGQTPSYGGGYNDIVGHNEHEAPEVPQSNFVGDGSGAAAEAAAAGAGVWKPPAFVPRQALAPPAWGGGGGPSNPVAQFANNPAWSFSQRQNTPAPVTGMFRGDGSGAARGIFSPWQAPGPAGLPSHAPESWLPGLVASRR